MFGSSLKEETMAKNVKNYRPAALGRLPVGIALPTRRVPPERIVEMRRKLKVSK